LTEPVRVVFDMTFPNRNPGGTGVYAKELIAALRNREDVAVTAVASAQRGLPSTLRWLVAGAQNALGEAPLLHCPASVAPWRLRIPFALTVHDTMANEVREDHPLEWRAYVRLFMPARARAAARVIVGSECLGKEIIGLWQVAPERVVVTPYGISPRFFVAAEGRQPNQVPIMLMPGAPIIRKNLELVLQAMAEAPDGTAVRRSRLKISGAVPEQFPKHRDRIHSLGLESRVEWLGRVPDDEMPKTVAESDLVVYPSLHEGFGFPALEAMATGTPVLASNAPCLPEVLGEGAMFVPPRDVKAFVDAAQALLGDASLRADLVARGRKHAARFTWERCADLTVEAYRAAIRAV
jgi:O-antigen biosynthesis alpha-1,3-rhamnosyltransferase